MGFLRNCLLLLPFVLAACSKDEPKPGRSASSHAVAPAPAAFLETVAALAPTDAQVVLQCASASRLAAVAQIAGRSAPPDPLAMLCMGAGINAANVDRTKPLAITVTLAAEAPPQMTFILPCADPAAVAKGYQGASATRGDYVALSTGPAPAAGGSSLPAALPGGDVSVRIDLAAILAIYGTDVDQALQGARMFAAQMAGASPGPVDISSIFEMYFAAAEKLVTSAESLDLAVTRADDGVVDLDLTFTAKTGSPLDLKTADRPSLRALAAELPAGFPCAAFVRLDWGSYMGWMGGFFDSVAASMPADRREAFQDYMKRSETAMAALGHEGAFAFECGADGLRAVMVYRSSDPETYVREYVGQMCDPAAEEMGLMVEDLGAQEVAGAKGHRLRIKMDLSKNMALMGMSTPEEATKILDRVLGRDGMVVDVFAKKGLVVVVMDPKGELSAHAAGGKATADRLAPTLDRASGSLDFALDVELRSLIRQMLGIVRASGMANVPDDVPAGPPLPISLAVASEGRVHHVGMTANITAIGDFFTSAIRRR